MNINKLTSLIILFLTMCLLQMGALEKAPDLIASSAILYDYSTGRILYEKEADLPIPPASLTKLVTLYLGWEYLKEGRFSPEDLVEITEAGSSFSRPSGSSLMLLEEGQTVTYLEILKGLAISSGNDAAYALAYFTKGSDRQFVGEMNRLVQTLGYETMHFVDPDGWSAENIITAREYASFAARYIRDFPDALKDVHSQEYFVYPKEMNLPFEGARILTPRKKKNTNILLGKVDGVDGLKTGYIDESGFNFTATAQRDKSRFIAVVLGIKDVPYFEGIELRAWEAENLLEYGFRNFKTVYPSIPDFTEITLWEGKKDSLAVELDGTPFFTLSIDEMPTFSSKLTLPEEMTAPIEKGDQIGFIEYRTDSHELAVYSVVAKESVERANIFKVLMHKVKRLFSKLSNP